MRRNNVEYLNRKDQNGNKYFRIWMKSKNVPKNKVIVAQNRKDAERQQREGQRVLEMKVAREQRIGKNSVFMSDLLTRHFLLLSPSRRADSRAIFQYWTKKIGEVKIVDFSRVILSDMQAEMQANLNEELMKSATLNKYINFLKQVLKKAYLEWEYFDQDFSVFFKTFKVENQRNRILTDQEKERLFKAAENLDTGYFVDLLHILFETGMRKMEALSLMGKHCDIKNKKILVERTKAKQSRTLPMTAKVEEILTRRKAKNGDGYIFDHLRWGSSAAAFMSKVCLQAQIKDFVLHDVRHNFASKMRENGISIEALQRIMGHSCYRSLNRYLHFEDTYEHEKMRQILDN